MKRNLVLTFLIIITSYLIFQNTYLSNNENLEKNINNLESIDPICDGIGFDEFHELKPNDIKFINIDIPQSANWYRNFFNAYLYSTQKGNFINENFKTKFNSNIQVFFENGVNCEFVGEVRINGDLKDHIDISNLISSLDVKLDTGSIFGITRFKLLIPETRRSDNEVFSSNLLKHLNFLSPRTFYVESSINGNKTHKFIFQEKISKEMLEHNGFREGPIIESNEKYIWNTSEDPFFRDDKKLTGDPLMFARIINEEWANRSFENKIIAIEAVERFNKSLFATLNDNQVNNEILSEDTTYIYMFEAANRALIANHGVATNHNRQFFYDRLTNTFIPVYYDGNPEFFNNPPRQPFEYANSKKLGEAAIKVKNIEINNEELLTELKNSGLDYDINQLKSYLTTFKKNLDLVAQYQNLEGYQHPNFESQINKKTKVDLYFLFDNIENGYQEVCSQRLINCKSVNISDEINIFESNLFFNNLPMYVFGKSKDNFFNDANSFDNLDYNNINVGSFLIKLLGSPSYDIDFDNQEIKFEINELNQKIVVTSDEIIRGWSFIVEDTISDLLQSRSDKNLLTGCLTFLNTKVQDLNVKVTGSHCEDGLNLINVNGNFLNLEINKASSDALDLDFSEVLVENIIISEAGNDCVDVSGGNYEFLNLNLNFCSDKSVSIGEHSVIKIYTLNSSNSKKGLVVKDSSLANILEFNGLNLETCVEVYRKKQEFGPSSLTVSDYKCDGSSRNFVQKGSLFNDN